MSGLHARTIGLLALAAIAMAVCLTALLSRPTHASSFTVDTTTDAVDAHPGDGVCATAAGQCSLRAAVQETNALSGADVISLPAGTFALTIGGAGEGEAATGDLDIAGDLTITGVSADDTIVSGGSIDRVFDVTGQFDVHFSGFTITQGNADIDGGAVINRGTMTLDRMRIENNMARDGAGLYNNGTMSVMDSTVIDNTSRDSGAGIHNDGVLTVTRSSIVHNHANFAGGGINSLNTLTVTDSAIIDNDAAGERGGGLSNSAEAVFTNVTVSGNHAAYSAGGIVNFDQLALNNVTVTNNEGGLLHAVIDNYETALIVFTNTIVAGNSAANCRNSGMLTSNGHNLEDGNTCGFGNAGDLINTYPGLAVLADNGGPTKTHALLPASAAIDAGGSPGCPPTDQRGVGRPADGNNDGTAVCDIGAYEFAGVVAVATVTPTGTRPATATATRTPTRTATRTPARTRTSTPVATVIFATVGDVDCDGTVDSIDAAIVLQFVAGLYDFSRCPVTGDVNHDGRTDAVDAAIILQYSAGLLTHWPP